MLEHAFLMMVHKSPELFGRIVHILAKDNHHFFINVDKKTANIDDFKQAVRDVKNVTFIPQMRVHHGSVEQIHCELALYRAAMNASVKIDYFHLISGQDYPLRSNEQFDSFMEQHKGRSFGMIDDDAFREECMKRKYPYRTNVFHPNGHNYLFRILRKLTWRLQLILHVRSYILDCWGGWNWRSLYRPVVTYLLDYVDKNPTFLKRFNHTNCCDEIYFTTLVHPLMDKLDIDGRTPLRYVSWIAPRPISSNQRPYILEEPDFPYVISSQAFFCRKVNLPQSEKLLDMIDEQRGSYFCFEEAHPIKIH